MAPRDDLSTSALRLSRRLIAHLLRRTALLALLGAALALIVLLVVGVEHTAGQVALVVIGTLISLALLPDEPHRIWNINARSLADNVPHDRLVGAGRAVLEAMAIQQRSLVPGPVLEQLWATAYEDIQRATVDPARIVKDMSYRIVVTPTSPGRMRVESEIEATRVLPGRDEVYISLCSDLRALMAEYGQSAAGCVLREIVDRTPGESPLEWLGRVSSYPVHMFAGGRDLHQLRIDQLATDGDSYVVRFVYAAGAVGERFTRIRLSARYDAVDDGSFDVKFSSYFTVGSTTVAFDLRDVSKAIDFNEFLSTSTRPIEVRTSVDDQSRQVVIATDERAVLPPGSGVVFEWASRPAELLQDLNLPIGELPQGEPPETIPSVPERRRRADDAGEALVPVTGAGVDVIDAYAALGVLAARPTLVRQSVNTRLQQARASLPPRFGLVVLDGWRSPEVQQQLIDHYSQGAVERGYVAAVDGDGIRPPHVTGGAVDVTLTYDGVPLALGTPYDEFSPSSHWAAYETVDSSIRRLRRLLHRTMTGAGFVAYPFEWWHWSYGDDVWAAAVGASAVLFDCVESAP